MARHKQRNPRGCPPLPRRRPRVRANGSVSDNRVEGTGNPGLPSKTVETTGSPSKHDGKEEAELEDAMEIDSQDQLAPSPVYLMPSSFVQSYWTYERVDKAVSDTDSKSENATDTDPENQFAHHSAQSMPDHEDTVTPDTESTDQEEQFQTRPSIRIVIPDNLKALIVDDWERVTKNITVVKLPAPRPVRQILREYREEEGAKRDARRLDLEILDEVIIGLNEYFDVMLNKVLLYRHERPQFRELRARFEGVDGYGPVDIYGAEHLVRLFSMFSSHPPTCPSHAFSTSEWVGPI